jgi:tetratricopeptide (TPR) repeat protein
MRRTIAVLLHLAIAPLLFAVSPRIAFERVLPAPHDLGDAEEIAIANANGNEAHLDFFVESFIDHVNRSDLLRMRDARASTGPADVYADVKFFRCDSAVRETEGSVRDIDGNRVKRIVFFVEAVCSARIDILTRFLKPQSMFFAKGEGRSPRVETVTDEERHHALADAARLAAKDAADRITPRRVRESILLDPTAPAFEEGYSRIAADRFGQARAIWETELRRQPRSAALRFNLGALCEALGDRRAAEQHYNAARQMAPNEPRYASELKLFARRGMK